MVKKNLEANTLHLYQVLCLILPALAASPLCLLQGPFLGDMVRALFWEEKSGLKHVAVKLEFKRTDTFKGQMKPSGRHCMLGLSSQMCV